MSDRDPLERALASFGERSARLSVRAAWLAVVPGAALGGLAGWAVILHFRPDEDLGAAVTALVAVVAFLAPLAAALALARTWARAEVRRRRAAWAKELAEAEGISADELAEASLIFD